MDRYLIEREIGFDAGRATGPNAIIEEVISILSRFAGRVPWGAWIIETVWL
jgi:hypothetical protein